MPSSCVDSLAEPFVRGTGRALTRGSGHGLGPAIVSAAAAHDGALTLRPNAEGGGLTATLELPSAEHGRAGGGGGPGGAHRVRQAP
ncbi:hypothetical protein GCM10028784_25580 [Myceligenerans cantabricum]